MICYKLPSHPFLKVTWNKNWFDDQPGKVTLVINPLMVQEIWKLFQNSAMQFFIGSTLLSAIVSTKSSITYIKGHLHISSFCSSFKKLTLHSFWIYITHKNIWKETVTVSKLATQIQTHTKSLCYCQTAH